MKPQLRWPLHPVSHQGEALSSWLFRVAHCYHMDLSDLLTYDLDHHQLLDLDINPPVDLLDKITSRSGINLNQLRGMSFAGWTPWLFDNFDPDSSAFDSYLQQISILLPIRKRLKLQNHNVHVWHAWLPQQKIYRACPEYLAENEERVLLLMWQLPLLLSCPLHDCWLESYLGSPGRFIKWEIEEPVSRLASKPITLMDHRTWQALTIGQVELPRRPIHAGIWFRLLRTLIEELNTPISYYPSQTRDIRRIWETCNHPFRAGKRIWRTYESFDLQTQLQMLEAAATAMHLIETKALTAHGAQAELFLPEPEQQIDNGWSHTLQQENTSPWPLAMASLREVIEKAKHDPEAAQGLLNFALFGRKDVKSINEVRSLLLDLQIPIEFLSHFSESPPFAYLTINDGLSD